MLKQFTYIKKNNIIYQDKKRPEKTKLMPAKLRAVLVCAESDSAQCQFWIFEKCSKIFRKINKWTLHSPEMQMFDSKKKFDSAQCQPILDFRQFIQANTARSHLFREYIHENETFRKTILDCVSGAQVGWIHRIK